ncbi:MAG TPA: hypothetical protein DHV67_03720 [Gallionella sp.]|nr:hypothetical protein [Gallionella sp.]
MNMENNANVRIAANRPPPDIAQAINDIPCEGRALVKIGYGEDRIMRKTMDVARINKMGWRSTTSLTNGISHACKDYVLQSAE